MIGRIEGQKILADLACLTFDGKIQWKLEDDIAVTQIGDLTLTLLPESPQLSLFSSAYLIIQTKDGETDQFEDFYEPYFSHLVEVVTDFVLYPRSKISVSVEDKLTHEIEKLKASE